MLRLRTRISTVTNHCVKYRSCSENNLKNQVAQTRKDKIKSFLFVDDINIYIENSNKPKNKVELISYKRQNIDYVLHSNITCITKF